LLRNLKQGEINMSKKFKREHFRGFDGEILACWKRADGSALLLSKSVYRGGEALDLREWFQDGGSFRASPRGLRLQSSEVDAIYAALDELQNGE
jgi:hypothetical protein